MTKNRPEAQEIARNRFQGAREMEKGINILDHKWAQLRVWLDNIADKRGLYSTLSIEQINEMLDFLDGMEKKMDDIIIKALGEKEK